MGRALNQEAETVPVSIYVHKLAVFGEGVRAHQKIVRHDLAGEHFPLFLRCFCFFPDNKVIVPAFQGIDHAAFLDCLGSSVCDSGFFRDQFKNLFQGFLPVFRVAGGNVSAGEFFDHGLAQ